MKPSRWKAFSVRLSIWLCVCAPVLAHALDLATIRQQLTAEDVVRGEFVQEKHLRALPQALRSQGEFVLARDYGLLWQLQQPLLHLLRITPTGIAQQLPDGRWQATANAASSRESRLFLALLSGDFAPLETSFSLDVQGSADDWSIRMTPTDTLLQRIFSYIDLRGGLTLQHIELHETQGDRTVVHLHAQPDAAPLSEAERQLYGR